MLVDEAVFIQKVLVDMHLDYLANNEVACTAFLTEFDDLLHFAFKLHRCFGDAKGRYFLGSERGKACLNEFVNIRCIRGACEAHLVYHVVVDYVDHDFRNYFGVVEGVFALAGAPRPRW